jgi:imidazolonepropionase-like amidohydrolase
MSMQQAELVIAADRVVGAAGDEVRNVSAVAIAGDRIVAVDTVEAMRRRVPEVAPWVEHSGCTLLPGLIDSHVHLTFSAGHFIARDLAADSDTVLALRGAVNARQALQAGVTTVRDLGGRGEVTLRLRDAIASGIVPGPRVLVSGRPITTPSGHLNMLGGVATGPDGVSALTRELIAEGVDAIKIIATGGNSTPSSDPLQPAYSLPELRAIVDVAHEAGRRVTAHARGVEGIRPLAESGIDGIEHCRMEVPPGVWEFDEALAGRLAEREIIAAPTLAASFRALQHLAAGGQVGVREGAVPIAARLENARRLRDAGVRVVVGTDAGACLARFDEAVHLELELLVDAGWSPLDAIRAGTLGAAVAIGREQDRGSLEPGNLADLLIVRGDPTRTISDIRAVEQVYLGGRAVTKAGQLTDDARPEPWPWPKHEPRCPMS